MPHSGQFRWPAPPLDSGTNPLRDRTDQRVLQLIWTDGPISRAEIADQTGISKPTVSESVRRMELAGLVRLAGTQAGRPGRVAQLYELARDLGYVVAIEMNVTQLRAQAADISGAIVAERSRPPIARFGPTEGGRILRDFVADLLADVSRHSGRLLTVTVSVADPVDPTTGRVISLFSADEPYQRVQPIDALAGLFDAPLLVENDVNLAALAERGQGVAAGVASFAYIYVGAGLGMGAMIGDQIVRGARGAAGEIGYLTFGHRTPGQLEERRRLAQSTAERGVGLLGFQAQSTEDLVDSGTALFARARQSDPAAIAALQGEATVLGEAIAAVCAVLDPEIIVLGGPLGIDPEIVDPVRRAVGALAPVPPPIVISPLGDSGPIRGALAVALHRARTDLWVGIEH